MTSLRSTRWIQWYNFQDKIRLSKNGSSTCNDNRNKIKLRRRNSPPCLKWTCVKFRSNFNVWISVWNFAEWLCIMRTCHWWCFDVYGMVEALLRWCWSSRFGTDGGGCFADDLSSYISAVIANLGGKFFKISFYGIADSVMSTGIRLLFILPT